MVMPSIPVPTAVPGYPVAVPYPTPNSLVGIDSGGNGVAVPGLSQMWNLIEDKTFSGSNVYTSPTWVAGTYRKLRLTITVITPPGSGALNITLPGRGGTYTINGAFGLGGAPAGLTSATWAIPNAGADTVFSIITMDVVGGRPLALLGQLSDTVSGHWFNFSGLNLTTTGNATGLVITGAANWAASIVLEGLF